ncbi:MAG: hypothetical protein SAJ12_08380 [Jaaginema sp. PMC 1079.18]|nr:hypothetical protein [Jaaginema sp. PMC 1080.18]MEC4851014.1 hypothetical protein [Jaaginema sp. PMC 1079.18]MEC4868761.1 hypothetical protein [Jaaginema sp. PMC 1078.18]
MINLSTATLKITEEEWENWAEINNLTGLAVQLCQFCLTRKPAKLLALIASEILFAFLISVFFVPISLIVMRSLDLLPRNPQAIQSLFLIFGGIVFSSLVLFNTFLWRYQRRFKSLARLLLEIEKYNQTIDSIALLSSLENVQASIAQDSVTSLSLQKQEDLVKVLQTTRQSLIDGLKIERILRQHQQTIIQGCELIANLETTCATLSTVEIRDRASEYSQIINDALSINLAVQREMNRLIR